MAKKIDYRFAFGKFNNMLETHDPRNLDEGYKILALTNILAMRPGTLQDCPECGLNMDGVQFAELAEQEMALVISRVQTDIRRLADTYIESGFVTGVIFGAADKDNGTTDGAQDCSLRIELKSGTLISIESENSSVGLQHKSITIDKTPFKSV
jgi:hypothetical protein